VTGWLAVVVAAVVFAGMYDAEQRALALASANSVGMTLLGALLVVVVWRRTGRTALAGAKGVALVGVAAAAAGAVAGRWLAGVLDAGGTWSAVGESLVVGALTCAVFAVVVAVAARAAVREAFGVLAKRPVGAPR
jgi:putative peptidoglycan lipid II flippase